MSSFRSLATSILALSMVFGVDFALAKGGQKEGKQDRNLDNKNRDRNANNKNNIDQGNGAKREEKDQTKKAPDFTINKQDCFTANFMNKLAQYKKEHSLNIQACADAGLEPFPEPQKVVTGIKGYADEGDGPKGTKNCEAIRKEEIETVRIDAFSSASIKALEVIERTNNTAIKKAAVECLARGLSAWAEKKAMTEVAGDKGLADRPRAMTLMPAVAGYIRAPEIREFARNTMLSGQRSMDQEIRSWFADLSKDFARAAQDRINSKKINNHLYAHGMITMGIALINKDKSLARVAADALTIGTGEVTNDGFLKAELERGSMTLTYSVISVFQMASIYAYGSGAPCVVSLNDNQEKKLIDLFVTTLKSQHDPGLIKKAANVRELSDGVGTPIENLLILLKMTRPSFYEKLVKEIRSRSNIDPSPYLTEEGARKSSKRELGGRLIRLGEVLQERQSEFKSALCGG